MTSLSELIYSLKSIDPEIQADALADALWLASYLDLAPFPRQVVDGSEYQPKYPTSDVDQFEQPKTSELSNIEFSDEQSENLEPLDDAGLSDAIMESPEDDQQSLEASDVSYPRAELFLQGTNPDQSDQIRGIPFRTPAVSALNSDLSIRKAFRPLRRTIPSRIEQEIDIDATVHSIAATGGLRHGHSRTVQPPELRPVQTRWLDLDFVVDNWTSMAPWKTTVIDLLGVLSTLGCFRTVTTWLLCKNDQSDLVLHPGLRSDKGTPTQLKSLSAPAGTRLTLVMSDCVAPYWRNGKLAAELNALRSQPYLALLQVLPRQLWGRTGLGPVVSYFRNPPGASVGVSNRQLVLRQNPNDYLYSDDKTDTQLAKLPREVYLPVITFSERSLARWSRFLAGGEQWVPGVCLSETPPSWLATSTPPPSSAEELVDSFWSTASSPQVRKLAGYLAAMPVLSLPLIRLIQHVMLPETSIEQLAEVYLAGLLVQHPSSEAASPDSIRFSFKPGVREQLLATMPTSETLDVVATVYQELGGFVDSHTGRVLDFYAILGGADFMANSDATGESLAFASVLSSVLRSLGGEYSDLAERMESVTQRFIDVSKDHYEDDMAADTANIKPDAESEAESALWDSTQNQENVFLHDREEIISVGYARTRSALIVGLGGTGQWVLTYLKKNLMESNDGVMPDNVKLLCFDNMPQASVSTYVAASKERGEGVKVGSVALETNTEFFHLGGDMREIGERLTGSNEANRKSLQHIDSWFDAQHWMQVLPRSSWVLSAGASQLRQFGRLGLFQDLTNPGQSKIWNRIDVAARTLERNLGGDRLEIVVVGSFAGGTGSGMFIDIALLLRERTKQVDSLIRGYFALPRVFDQNPDEELKARSFAAWRELNRFMAVSNEFPMPTQIYNPGDKRLQIHKFNHRLYDACYLVDGKRAGKRIDAEPQKIVFPAIADAISALLDDTAGGHYTEYVGTNLAPEYAKKPGVPLYSAVGAHSFKVPVYYAQQEFSYQLTAELVEELIKPVRDNNKNPDLITWVSPASPFDPVRTGRMDAQNLLTRDYRYQGNSEETTLFTKRIADIVNAGGADNGEMVEAFARGSLASRGGRGRVWLEDFTQLGNRQDVQELSSQIAGIASLQLSSAVKLSRDANEDPRHAPGRFEKAIPPFVTKNYGGRDAQGNDYGGRFGDALAQAAALQTDIFQRNAQLWVMNTLMGENPEDALGSKGGRIGYAYDLLNGTVDMLGKFLEFMKAVDEKRTGDVQPRLKAEDIRRGTKAEMLKDATRRFLGLRPHPRAHGTQESYLRAEQLVIDIRKDELLHKHIEDAAKRMRNVATEMRDELGQWIVTLATGDPATRRISLCEALDNNRRAAHNTSIADARLLSQTTIPAPEYPIDRNELERMMRSVHWALDSQAADFRLRLSLESEDDGSVVLQRTTGEERSEMRRSLTQRNLSSILGYAYRRFSRLPADTRIARLLAEEYRDAERFVDAIEDKAQPFFGGPFGNAAKWAILICISQDSDRLDSRTLEFVSEIQSEMRRRYGVDLDVADQNRLVQVVGSTDLHKCTLVCTDDLYEVELFDAWEECQAAYLEATQLLPHLNHNFRAEINAVQFELALSRRRGMKYRVLHPWVVMLLEYQERFEQFLVMRALGWFKLESDGAKEWLEMHLPGQRRPFVLTTPSRIRPGTFRLIHSFVLSSEEQTVGSSLSIDYDEISRSLYSVERGFEADNWISLLESQLASGDRGQTSVKWIDSIVHTLSDDEAAGMSRNLDEPSDRKRAYTDLSSVAALIIERLIDEKKLKQL